MQDYNQIQELSLVARTTPSLRHLLSCISEYVSVCMELLSFDYTQINVAIQPRSIDISPLYIHQHSTQCCRNSCCNINARHDQKLCGQQPINQANCRGSTERGVGGGDHDRSRFMLLLQCSVTSKLIVSGLLWYDKVVTADWLITVCVLSLKSWSTLCVCFVSTAQSFLCGAADGISGVVDDGCGEQKPSWAAADRTAGIWHTHTHKIQKKMCMKHNRICDGFRKSLWTWTKAIRFISCTLSAVFYC